MRVFVAGATGVLGRRVVEQLVAAGHVVTAVSRTADRDGLLRAAGATPVRVALFDPSAVRAAVAGHDAVVNVATSIPPLSRAAWRRAWRTNDRLRTEASRTLVDAAIATGASRYVQESVGFLYADAGGRWIDESAPLAPEGPTATAVDAEAEAARFTAAGGTGVALRFAEFVAGDSGHFRELLPFLERGWLPLVGDHDGYQSFVDADDAAAAVVAALDAPAGVYNVAEDDPAPRHEHAAALSDVLDRPVRLPPAIVGSLPPLRVKARSQRISNRRLQERTGWSPRRPSMAERWTTLLPELRSGAET
ncbi:MAG: NAD(P)-dependent oxidoreductase [Actinobacteria bacterium]|nr:NAD(P)-dependent oxidoreductase [Actinomycetota bacterium]